MARQASTSLGEVSVEPQERLADLLMGGLFNQPVTPYGFGPLDTFTVTVVGGVVHQPSCRLARRVQPDVLTVDQILMTKSCVECIHNFSDLLDAIGGQRALDDLVTVLDVVASIDKAARLLAEGRRLHALNYLMTLRAAVQTETVSNADLSVLFEHKKAKIEQVLMKLTALKAPLKAEILAVSGSEQSPGWSVAYVHPTYSGVLDSSLDVPLDLDGRALANALPFAYQSKQLGSDSSSYLVVVPTSLVDVLHSRWGVGSALIHCEVEQEVSPEELAVAVECLNVPSPRTGDVFVAKMQTRIDRALSAAYTVLG